MIQNDATGAWLQGAAVGLVTVQGNEARVREATAELARIGVQPSQLRVVKNARCTDCTRIQQVSAAVRASHRATLLQLTQDFPEAGHYILFEDDIQFDGNVEKVHRRVDKAWARLRAKPMKWSLLLLGYASLGPIVPLHHNLAAVPRGYTSHAYVLSRGAASTLLKQPVWRRGYDLEGWRRLPWRERFGVFPPVAFQSAMPREVPKLLHKLSDYRKLTTAHNAVMLGLPWFVILVILCVALCIIVARRRCSRQLRPT